MLMDVCVCMLVCVDDDSDDDYDGGDGDGDDDNDNNIVIHGYHSDSAMSNSSFITCPIYKTETLPHFRRNARNGCSHFLHLLKFMLSSSHLK